MKKILVALIASAVMMANVSAMVPADEKMGQAAQKLQELVAEAKKAGLSTQETLGLVAQGLEQDALLNIPKLTTQQKEALMYFGLGLISGGVIITGIWALKNYFGGEKKTTTTTNKDEAKKDDAKPAVVDNPANKPTETVAETTTAEKPAEVVEKPAVETAVEKPAVTEKPVVVEKPVDVVKPVEQPVVPPTATTAEKPAVEEKK